MSGWFCLLHLDGAPVDEGSARQLHALLHARGPHGSAHYLEGPVALGMSVLETGDAAPPARAVAARGPLRAVGQVRVDARADVGRALGIDGAALAALDDLSLLLCAFEKHGDDVVSVVRGEYALAVWNSDTRSLTLLRDAFGVRQLFYGQVSGPTGRWLVASNTLPVVRDLRVQGASMSLALDDDALLDFLLFEGLMELEATPFQHIRRLRGGDVLIARDGGVSTHARWRIACPPVDRRASIDTHAERFFAALSSSVNDRRAARTTLFLSGGIDSPAIAAAACARGGTAGLAALTAVYDTERVAEDADVRLAGETARALAIPWRTTPSFKLPRDEVLARGALLSLELTHQPYELEDQLYTQAVTHGPVALHGEGGDELWRGEPLAALVARVPLLSLARELVRSAARGVRPPLGARQLARRLAQTRARAPSQLPPWLTPSARARAQARMASIDDVGTVGANAPERALAARTLTSPLWCEGLLANDASATGVPLEVRYPMLDARVVDAALRVPTFPGTVGKTVARTALRGRVPASVLARPKRGVDDTLLARGRSERPWRALESAVAERFRSADGVGRFVDVDAVTRALESGRDPEQFWVDLRPLSLARWWASLPPGRGA